MHKRRKITASLNKHLTIDNVTGTFTKKFEFHLLSFELYLNQLLLDTLNHSGLSKWSLNFTEIIGQGFRVDIYCDSEEEFKLIYKTIIHKMTDTKLIFHRRPVT